MGPDEGWSMIAYELEHGGAAVNFVHSIMSSHGSSRRSRPLQNYHDGHGVFAYAFPFWM